MLTFMVRKKKRVHKTFQPENQIQESSCSYDLRGPLSCGDWKHWAILNKKLAWWRRIFGVLVKIIIEILMVTKKR